MNTQAIISIVSDLMTVSQHEKIIFKEDGFYSKKLPGTVETNIWKNPDACELYIDIIIKRRESDNVEIAEIEYELTWRPAKCKKTKFKNDTFIATSNIMTACVILSLIETIQNTSLIVNIT